MHFCHRRESALLKRFFFKYFYNVWLQEQWFNQTTFQMGRLALPRGSVSIRKRSVSSWEVAWMLGNVLLIQQGLSQQPERQREARVARYQQHSFSFLFFKVVRATLHELCTTFCRFRWNPDKNLLQSSSGIFTFKIILSAVLWGTNRIQFTQTLWSVLFP